MIPSQLACRFRVFQMLGAANGFSIILEALNLSLQQGDGAAFHCEPLPPIQHPRGARCATFHPRRELHPCNGERRCWFLRGAGFGPAEWQSGSEFARCWMAPSCAAIASGASASGTGASCSGGAGVGRITRWDGKCQGWLSRPSPYPMLAPSPSPRTLRMRRRTVCAISRDPSYRYFWAAQRKAPRCSSRTVT
jgi:hypothetical protein